MVLPICKFCEANAGHNHQLRLLKVKWGTFRQGCSPLLFYGHIQEIVCLKRNEKHITLNEELKSNEGW
jgi:hypothetical protein